MSDSDIDNALLTATEKAREAEERLRHTPVESPEIMPEAYEVNRRVEDVYVLAEDAAESVEE